MLRLGRASAVAAEEHGAPSCERGDEKAGHALEGIDLAREDREERGGALGEDAADAPRGGRDTHRPRAAPAHAGRPPPEPPPPPRPSPPNARPGQRADPPPR